MKISSYVAVSLALATQCCFAAPTAGPIGRITSVISYTQFGGGDVVFRLDTPSPDCPGGYWISKSDPGFNANLLLVITAHSANTPVEVWAHPDVAWSGSSSKYCKLYSISVVR